jgi:hypothetical protein
MGYCPTVAFSFQLPLVSRRSSRVTPVTAYPHLEFPHFNSLGNWMVLQHRYSLLGTDFDFGMALAAFPVPLGFNAPVDVGYGVPLIGEDFVKKLWMDLWPAA